MMETGLDLGFGPPLVRNHVAYLDWEWDIGQHARRLDMIISPEDQERLGVNIVYRNCGGRPLRKQIDELRRLVAEEGVTYIIIDSASPACGRASDNDEIVE
jgi:predicted metalloprotease